MDDELLELYSMITTETDKYIDYCETTKQSRLDDDSICEYLDEVITDLCQITTLIKKLKG
jgi:hypothetical protein